MWQNRIPYFFDNVLKTPAGSLPKGAQWVIAFDDLAGNIIPAISLALRYEKKDWQIESAAGIVTSESFQTTNGCVFAQAIDLPGESLVVNPEGNIMSNSLLRSYVGQGRNQFPAMRMTFLETNASFVDNFLRPWVIATGMFGLLAREPGDTKNYRTNLVCYKLGTLSQSEAPIPLMEIVFYDVCCVAVSNEEYNYAPLAGQPTMREAQFVYNYYTINTNIGKAFHDNSNPTSQVLPVQSKPQNNTTDAYGQLLERTSYTIRSNRNIDKEVLTANNQIKLDEIVAQARVNSSTQSVNLMYEKKLREFRISQIEERQNLLARNETLTAANQQKLNQIMEDTKKLFGEQKASSLFKEKLLAVQRQQLEERQKAQEKFLA